MVLHKSRCQIQSEGLHGLVELRPLPRLLQETDSTSELYANNRQRINEHWKIY